MHLLVIRTSAMGDVALVAPVLRAFETLYPETRITLVTRSAFRPFFHGLRNLEVFCPDFRGRHKGLNGLLKLYSDLRNCGNFDHVIDLHDVLRSRILRFLFLTRGIGISVIDKGRPEKQNVIKGRSASQLKHTVERYCQAFAQAGFGVDCSGGPWIRPVEKALNSVSLILEKSAKRNIGVAPFAKHHLKRWPPENMIRLLELIAEKHASKFWFFGGREEAEMLQKMADSFPGSVNAGGKYTMEEELALISRMDLMITMDSANMHLSALTGTKTLSIWGATDPLTGFGPWGQPDEYSVRIRREQLSCRPCTVYGKGKCRRGDFACMTWLTPERVFEVISSLRILE